MQVIVEQTATSYEKLVTSDMFSKLEPINKSINDMLARLEEFQTMISFAKSEENNITCVFASSLHESNKDITELFGRIDATEDLINRIKDDLSSLEVNIVKAEQELGCAETSKMSSILTPLFVQRKSNEKFTANELPEMFKTEYYFHTEM